VAQFECEVSSISMQYSSLIVEFVVVLEWLASLPFTPTGGSQQRRQDSSCSNIVMPQSQRVDGSVSAIQKSYQLEMEGSRSKSDSIPDEEGEWACVGDDELLRSGILLPKASMSMMLPVREEKYAYVHVRLLSRF
jgi:hypothetical protein